MPTLPNAHRQAGYALRLEWGEAGALAVAPGCDVAVVVDVLSFTTTVSVAVDRGVTVWPYRWADDGARALAAEHDATLAVGRSAPGVSLSPCSVRDAPDLRRLVLPSPNGSTICARLAGEVPEVVAVSLRNRSAAVRWLRERRPARLAVVCAGERWPDGGSDRSGADASTPHSVRGGRPAPDLRPAVEDLWGAGALVGPLIEGGWPDVAPEARAAAAAFADAEPGLAAALRACASGRELIDAGHPDDVSVAADLDAGRTVPVLRDGAFGA